IWTAAKRSIIAGGRPKAKAGSAGGALNVAGGIDGATVHEDLEVDVGTGGAAGGPHQGDGLALFHHVALLHQVTLVVAVAGDPAPAVVDLDEVAIAVAPARPGDHTGGDADHLAALGAGEVDAVVVADPAGEGVVAPTVGRGQPALVDGPPGQ